MIKITKEQIAQKYAMYQPSVCERINNLKKKGLLKVVFVLGGKNVI